MRRPTFLVDKQFGYVRFTTRPREDQYCVFWGRPQIGFYLYARGRHCYAARATR